MLCQCSRLMGTISNLRARPSGGGQAEAGARLLAKEVKILFGNEQG